MTNGVNGHKGGGTAKNKGRKAAAGRDELVEMRFYIPGTVVKNEKNGDEENESNEDAEDVEEQNAANLFYETLIDKAEIGEVAGDTFATFLDVLHLTPRYRKFTVITHDRTNSIAGDVSTSICTKAPFAYVAKHTTTRFSISPSRNSSSSQKTTKPTLSSHLVWIHHYARVRPGIHLL